MAIGVRVRDSSNQLLLEREFADLPVRIGRSELNDLQLKFSVVSQFHAVLESQRGKVVLRDLGSTNGTWISGSRAPMNQAVDLGPHENRFGIANLQLEIYEPSHDVPASSMPRNPLNVSSMLNMAGHTPPPNPTAWQAERMAIDRHRNSARDLCSLIEQNGARLPPESRKTYLLELVEIWPGLAHEPEFERLATQNGVFLMTRRQPAEVAFQGLRELAQALTPDSGQLNSPEEIVRFLTKLREAIGVLLKSFVPLRDGQRQFQTDMSLGSPARPDPANPARTRVDGVADAKELAALLFDFRSAQVDAAYALESAFADVMIHQVAMLNGILAGVRSILGRLSPESIERSVEGPVFGKYKALWKEYEVRFAEFDEGDRYLSSVIFGQQFERSYLAEGQRVTAPVKRGS